MDERPTPPAPTSPAPAPTSPAPTNAPAPAPAPAKANPPATGDEPTIFQRMRGAPITVALTLINFAAFAWVEQHGGSTNVGTLLEYGTVEPVHVWAGETWRLGTYMFLHIGWIHILVNTYASFGWATMLERALGKTRFLLLYLLSGIGGGCGSVIAGLLWTAHPSAGASGALFGIIGAVLALRLRRLESVSAFLADKGVRSIGIQLAIWFAIGSQIGFDNAAHVGGFVVGAAMAWLFTVRAARLGWVAFAAGFVALIAFAAQPWPPRQKDVGRILSFSRAYLTGEIVDTEGVHPWPKDQARGVRFLDKACRGDVAPACAMLAQHIDLLGAPDAVEKSAPLHRRACDLDPKMCQQLH